MYELKWMLELSDELKISLREDAAKELGLEVRTTVGKLREAIEKPEDIQEMIEIEDDLEMEL